MLEEQKVSQDSRDYTIKIVPSDGSDVRSVTLPARTLKFGIASACIGALLFVGAFSYAVYSSYSARSNSSQIEKLQQVNNIQQEQLLQLSKKANALQDDVDKLGRTEMELRQITGIDGGAAPASGTQTAPAGDSAAASFGGQGGPVVAPNVENVSAALDNVEKSLQMRKASLEQLKEQLKAQNRSFDVQNMMNVTIPSIWPASGEVSSPYGLRWNGSDFHPGIDIANDFGTPIFATADGVVEVAGWNAGGYGNMVDINHGNGYKTRYGHAQQVVVYPGQQVRRGQVIAYMGSTGYSTGPHVHYEVIVNGQQINPVGYL